jgi:hypothetical protein
MIVFQRIHSHQIDTAVTLPIHEDGRPRIHGIIEVNAGVERRNLPAAKPERRKRQTDENRKARNSHGRCLAMPDRQGKPGRNRYRRSRPPV